QETFLRAYRALPGFGGEFRLAGWLHRILDNVCSDECGRRSRDSAVFGRLAAGLAPASPDVADDTTTRDAVRRALMQIPPAQREALVLREIEGMGYREVAAAAGITEENARARAHRARAVLRSMLGGPAAILGAVVAVL